MRSRACKTKAEAAFLARRASALVAAAAVLLALVFASVMPESMTDAMIGLTAPSGSISPEAGPAPSESSAYPEMEIRLVRVDGDVASVIAARLVTITAEVLDKQQPFDLAGDGPKVLIYHTHNTEAYTQTENCAYVPSGDWRTEDQTRSVIAVGEELARILNEDYGIETIHDTTAHEPPLITTAYSRSLQTMQRYKEKYPSIEMFIDLHRDGVSAEGYENDFVVIDGAETARLMFVVGTGRGSSGAGEEPLPDFESNYALAISLTQRLLSFDPHLCRSVRVKSGRYNQQVSSKCILVEVGHNANTLEQALAAMPLLARAIAECAGIRPSPSAVSFSP